MRLRTNNILLLTFVLIISGFIWFGETHGSEPIAYPTPDLRLESDYRDRTVFDEAEEAFLCEFENHILSLEDELPIPGAAVAIVKNGRIIYKRGFGVRDVESNEPVTTSTIFRIGSVSKGFSAGLAGLLEHEGYIEWQNPITKYLPCYHANPVTYADSLTPERILSHTTGYPYQAYSTLIEDGATLDEMINRLQVLKMPRIPGEIHAYQNVAYSLIEKILESCTDNSFRALMENEIFRPLGMNTASTDYISMMSAQNVALPHYATRSGFRLGKVSDTYYNACAAGGINASINDMGEWLLAVMGNRPDVLPQKVLDELYRTRIRTAVKNNYLSLLETPRKGYYGLGWRIVEYPSDTLIYHEGYVNGYKSAIGFSQTNDIGICILANAGGSFSSKLLADFFKMDKTADPTNIQ